MRPFYYVSFASSLCLSKIKPTIVIYIDVSAHIKPPVPKSSRLSQI